MTDFSREILQNWQIRKSKKEKADFRARLTQVLEEAGYKVQVEKHKTIWASHNVVAGDPEKADLLLTAHYDTCAVLPFPNFITPRNFLWYLAYQLVITFVFFTIVFGVTFGVTYGLMLVSDGAIGPAIGALTGYVVLIFGMWWLFDGKANRHTANDNTSGVMTLVETALTLPEELRQSVCFVWFDNEERGLLGSSAFAGKHKAVKKNTLVLNFDCVGDGDSLQFFPTKQAKKDDTAKLLSQSFLPAGEKTVEVVSGFGFYPSDQAAFRRGVGVCALKKSKFFGWYMDRIHTRRDTVLDEQNIDLLRAGAVRMVKSVVKKEETHV